MTQKLRIFSYINIKLVQFNFYQRGLKNDNSEITLTEIFNNLFRYHDNELKLY